MAGEGVCDRDPRADWIGEALSEPANAIFNSYLKSLFYFLELLKCCLNIALKENSTTFTYQTWARRHKNCNLPVNGTLKENKLHAGKLRDEYLNEIGRWINRALF